MKGAAAVFAISFLMAGSLSAQVHIVEQATISPAPEKKAQAGNTNNHSIRFEFYWDGTPKGQIEWFSICGCTLMTTIEETSSSQILTIYSPPVQWYYFDPYLWIQYCTENQPADYSWKLYYDDSLVKSGSGNRRLVGDCYIVGEQWAQCSPDGYPICSFWPPYYSDFDFSLNSHQFLAGDSTGMNLDGTYASDCCTSVAWLPTDPLTLTIVSGSQYASLHLFDPQMGTDTKLGSVVTTTGSDAGRFSLVADGDAPDSNDCWVTVQAEGDGVIKTDSAHVLPFPDHFYIEAEPDTIDDSASTTIFAQAKNASDEDMDFGGNIQILASPSGYGHLGYNPPPVPCSIERGLGSRKNTTVNSPSSDRTSSKKLQAAALAIKKFAASMDSVIVVDYPTANAGRLLYTADGIVPDSNTTITFTVTAVGKPSATGNGNVVIRALGCPLVVFSADTINPGDTINVTVRKENDDGTITDYPSGTTFNIGIVSGGDYGNLLANGELGSSFDNVDVPIQFIANENNAADSVMVSMRATVNSGVSGSVSQNAKALNKGIKKVSNVKKNGKKFLNDEGGICNWFSNLFVKKIELVVLEPLDNQLLQKVITDEPKMPQDMIVKAQLKNFDGNADFYVTIPDLDWYAPRTETDKVPQLVTTGYIDGHKNGSGIVEIHFNEMTYKDGGAVIRGGDRMNLEVKAVAKGKTYTKPITNPFKIIGSNPSLPAMLAALNGLQYEAVACHESSFQQFNPSPGFPYQGRVDGRDMGIMQIHQYAGTQDDDVIWNWRANVEAGKNILDGLFSAATSYHEKWEGADTLDADQQLIEAYCEYNGGGGRTYWYWEKGDPTNNISGHWERAAEEDERTEAARDYGEDVFDLYQNPTWR